MKKFLQITSIILSLILLLSFVSCNSAGEAEDGYFAPGANYAPDGSSGDFSYGMSGILAGNVSAELDGNFSAADDAILGLSDAAYSRFHLGYCKQKCFNS
jgi:hypothetical protein